MGKSTRPWSSHVNMTPSGALVANDTKRTSGSTKPRPSRLGSVASYARASCENSQSGIGVPISRPAQSFAHCGDVSVTPKSALSTSASASSGTPPAASPAAAHAASNDARHAPAGSVASSTHAPGAAASGQRRPTVNAGRAALRRTTLRGRYGA